MWGLPALLPEVLERLLLLHPLALRLSKQRKIYGKHQQRRKLGSDLAGCCLPSAGVQAIDWPIRWAIRLAKRRGLKDARTAGEPMFWVGTGRSFLPPRVNGPARGSDSSQIAVHAADRLSLCAAKVAPRLRRTFRAIRTFRETSVFSCKSLLPRGLEPLTACLEGRCSIRLSYGSIGQAFQPDELKGITKAAAATASDWNAGPTWQSYHRCRGLYTSIVHSGVWYLPATNSWTRAWGQLVRGVSVCQALDATVSRKASAAIGRFATNAPWSRPAR